MAEVRVTGNVG